MLPVILDVTDRLVVVIGGGAVGRRKADALLNAGARVRLICLQPSPPDLPTKLHWLTEPYHRDHLADALLVFAAATAEVNRLVVADAKAHGLWVNSATDPETGHFVLPATARRGRLTLAVSTDGAAPALARRLARQLLDPFDDVFADWLDLLAEVRPLVLARIADPHRRRELFEQWSEADWLERFRREGRAAIHTAMLKDVEALARSSEHSV